MSEVAYLLGAGASAQCIPVVNGMEAGIEVLLKDIHPMWAKHHNSVFGEERTKFNQIYEFGKTVLKRLQTICSEYYSIDTYAKQLYLTNKVEFDKLKLDLCFYFTIMQVFRKKDKRYDNFFSSIINELGSLPPRIKVISWNYDYQLELSHGQFTEEKSLKGNRALLNMISPSNFADFENFLSQFSVIKLNGSASFKDDKGYRYLYEDDECALEGKMVRIFSEFYKVANNSEPIETDLRFAWENKDFKEMFRVLGKELNKIQTLVVIGYSFPFFNRTIDMELFSQMPNLKTIYIQDIAPDDIREILVEFVPSAAPSADINVIGKTNLTQFVFPNDLDITGPEGHAIKSIA